MKCSLLFLSSMLFAATLSADCTAPNTLVCGAAPATDSLVATDCTASDTSYYDAWQFNGVAGDQVTIDLSSTSFDAYLVLLDPNGKPVADNDDVLESNTNSRISFTLTASGKWTVIANTLKPGNTGEYAIAMTSSACTVAAPAGPRRRTAGHQ